MTLHFEESQHLLSIFHPYVYILVPGRKILTKSLLMHSSNDHEHCNGQFILINFLPIVQGFQSTTKRDTGATLAHHQIAHRTIFHTSAVSFFFLVMKSYPTLDFNPCYPYKIGATSQLGWLLWLTRKLWSDLCWEMEGHFRLMAWDGLMPEFANPLLSSQSSLTYPILNKSFSFN